MKSSKVSYAPWAGTGCGVSCLRSASASARQSQASRQAARRRERAGRPIDCQGEVIAIRASIVASVGMSAPAQCTAHQPSPLHTGHNGRLQQPIIAHSVPTVPWLSYPATPRLIHYYEWECQIQASWRVGEGAAYMRRWNGWGDDTISLHL